MQSLLGKRNLLRSRLRGEQSANAAPARVTPVKPVAATKPAPMPAVATSPQAEVQPAARPEMPGRGSAMQTGYDDLPLSDAYEEGASDYEEYLSQGLTRVCQCPVAHAGSDFHPASSRHHGPPSQEDLPPWDLGADVGSADAAPAVAAMVPAAPPVAASEPQPAIALMETIDWDALESDAQPEEEERSPV
jgi:DNA polymerase-3 subunit gamma/tau